MCAKEITAKVDDIHTIDMVIEDFLARRLEKAALMSPYYQDLWAEISRLIHSGGKRLRPRLAVLSYHMFGGANTQAILPAAASLELLHLGMLVHDDIIDRDYVRYGVDNIAGGYNKKYDELVPDRADRLHYAHSAAILAGDLLLSEAYVLMAEASVDAKQILAIQKLLGQSIFEVIGGELLDTETAFRAAGEISTEKIARYKTASYTTTLPMLVGAQLANVSEENQVHVRTFGRNLGIAFQLRDDIIGVFGDEVVTGKTTIGDIREGKRTYMIEQFYALASAEQAERFDNYFGNSAINDDEAAIVRELLKVSGAVTATEQAIADFEHKARMGLEQLVIDSAYYEQLNDVITAVTKRVK
jgi:geranylgeranyl diphosphate synthase type II